MRSTKQMRHCAGEVDGRGRKAQSNKSERKKVGGEKPRMAPERVSRRGGKRLPELTLEEIEKGKVGKRRRRRRGTARRRSRPLLDVASWWPQWTPRLASARPISPLDLVAPASTRRPIRPSYRWQRPRFLGCGQPPRRKQTIAGEREPTRSACPALLVRDIFSLRAPLKYKLKIRGS